MLEVIPYILWACVALFVWWLCGTLGLVFETLAREFENKRRGYILWGSPEPDNKRLLIRLGPISMVLSFFVCLVEGWKCLMKDRQSGFFVRPFAIVGSKVGDWLVATFITKSKGF